MKIFKLSFFFFALFQAWMGTRQKRECKYKMSFGECLAPGKPVQALWRLELHLSHQAALHSSCPSESSQAGLISAPLPGGKMPGERAVGGGEDIRRGFHKSGPHGKVSKSSVFPFNTPTT